MLRVANALDSSTVSAGSVRRRLDLTGRGQVDTLTVSIYGLDPAFLDGLHTAATLHFC